MGSLLVSRVLPASTSARRLVDSSTRRLSSAKLSRRPWKGGKRESAPCSVLGRGLWLLPLRSRPRSSALFCKGSPQETGGDRIGRPADGRLPAPLRRAPSAAAFLSFAFSATRSFKDPSPWPPAECGGRSAAAETSALCSVAACRRLPLCSSLAFGLRSRRLVGSWARGLVGSALRRRETREDRNYNTDRAPSSSSQLHSPPHDPMTRSPLKEDGSSSERSSSPAGLVGSWASLSPRCSKSSDRFHRCCNCRLIEVPPAQSRSRLPDDDALTSTGTVCYSLDPIPTVVFKSEQRRQMCK